MAFTFFLHLTVSAVFCLTVTSTVLRLPTAVRDDPSPTCPGIRAGPADFNYDPNSPNGPPNWGNIKDAYAKCSNGNQQSSFEVRATNFSNTGRPVVRFRTSLVKHEETPGNFEFKCEEEVCGVITYKGKHYEMEQLHFHENSEHYLEGVAFPMEGHFVHKAADGSLAVVAVLFELGSGNSEIDKLWKIAASEGEEEVELDTFYQDKPRVCATVGSLTTPPCTEGITWLISKEILSVSQEQLDYFACMLGNTTNNRPIQPSNNREVVCYEKEDSRGDD